jgi:hypothetical protein
MVVSVAIIMNRSDANCAQDRPRPIKGFAGNNTVYKTLITGDTHQPMRGTSMAIANGGGDDLNSAKDPAFWLRLRNEMHFNLIRVCDFDSYNRSHGGTTWSTLAQKLDVLDKCVDNAAIAGMYMVINYHDFPMDSDQKWQYCYEFWRATAPRYKNRSHVIYELNNEPYFTDASGYINNMDKFQQVYRIARDSAPNTPRILFTFPMTGDNDPDIVAAQCSFADWNNAQDFVGWHSYGTMGGSWYCGTYEPCLDNWAHVEAFQAQSYPRVCTEWGWKYFDDTYWTNPAKLELNQYALSAQSFETLSGWRQSWICWVIGHRPQLLQSFGLERFKPDAQSKGYFWPIDTMSATGAINRKSINPASQPRTGNSGVDLRKSLFTIRGQRMHSLPNAAPAVVIDNPGSIALSIRTGSVFP